jgi:branched-chain amino acid transport system permease protein
MPFVRTPDLNLHYETGGKGKDVLLLLHGNFASWRWWLPVLKNTPDGFRAYAPDLRGCGDSDRPEEGYTIARHAEDLDQLIRALGLPRLHLVGHSLGGCIALEYALKRPGRIKTLTLVAPAPAEGKTVLKATGHGGAYAGSAGTIHSAYRMSERWGTTRNVFKRSLGRMMQEDKVGDDFEALVDDAVRMSWDAAAGHIESLSRWDVRDALGGLNLPVLVIGGQNDELIPPGALREAVLKMPKARLIIWPAMGHAPQLEQPERFIRILKIFTSRHTNHMPQKIRNFFSRFTLAMAQTHYQEPYLLCG